MHVHLCSGTTTVRSTHGISQKQGPKRLCSLGFSSSGQSTPPSVPHRADDLEASSLHHMKCYHSFTCLLLAEFQGLLGWLITAILCTDQNILGLSFLRATDQNLTRYPKEKEKERSHQVSRWGPPYEKVSACLGWHQVPYEHSKYGPPLMALDLHSLKWEYPCKVKSFSLSTVLLAPCSPQSQSHWKEKVPKQTMQTNLPV